MFYRLRISEMHILLQSTFEEDIMTKASVSNLSYFSECRRKFYWDQTYRTPIPTKSLWVGQVVHAGLDAYYRNGRDSQKAIEAARDFALSEIDRYQEGLPSIARADQALSQPAEEALGFLANYCLYDEENRLEGTIEKVEVGFKLPTLSDPDKLVSGRIDLILRASSGRLWVVDHKTMSQKPSLAGLDVDEQMTAYAWAVWRMFGEIPERIIYNVIIKNFPAPPTVLKSGKLSKDKSQPTTYSLFRRAIDEYKLDVNDYRDMLGYLAMSGWSNYFSRVESSRNLAELEAFDRRACVKIRDIQAILSDPENEAYPSPSSFTCSYCPYLGACKAKDDGGDVEAILDSRFVRW